MKNDNYLIPRKFKIKNQDGYEIEINSLFILYIKVSKETKIFYLTEPIYTKDGKTLEVRCKTRIFGISKLLELLGSKGFIQINKTTIIRNLYISGRDNNWKYIYVTMPFKRTVGETGSSWRNVELPLGRKFAPQVKKHILESLFDVKNMEGDIFYISPLDIAFVELSQNKKILHLSKPVCNNDKCKYVLEWHSRHAFEKLLPESTKIYFIQVHRKYYVRIDYPFKVLHDHGKTYLFMDKSLQGDHENDKIYNTKIPVGEKFKKEIDEVFKNR